MASVPFYILVLCIVTLSQQGIAADNTNNSLSLKSGYTIETAKKNRHTLTSLPSPSHHNASLTTLPPIPGFALTYNFDHSEPLRPLEIYHTAIQLMYELAQRSWDASIHPMVTEQLEGYDVIILIMNPEAPAAPNQLLVSHSVTGLYRSVVTMTERILFCQLRSQLLIQGKRIGALSITTINDKSKATPPPPTTTIKANITSNSEAEVQADSDDDGNNKHISAINNLGANRGQLRDPINPQFVLKYYFYGKTITSKEVALAVLEALATAAPHGRYDDCKELEAVTKSGGCAIFVNPTTTTAATGKNNNGDELILTYEFVTRALVLLFAKIVVPYKRFGDCFVELEYENEKFGELRMLRAAESKDNGTDAVRQDLQSS
ncbi:MAG: hypothetical protein Q9201_006600 [Fulgogasparrea decipioides]